MPTTPGHWSLEEALHGEFHWRADHAYFSVPNEIPEPPRVRLPYTSAKKEIQDNKEWIGMTHYHEVTPQAFPYGWEGFWKRKNGRGKCQ
jgi:hypothetical protein